MTSTKKLDEVVIQLFGDECLQALNQVDVVAALPDEGNVVTIDELTNAYLGKEVTSAFPKVDLKEERAGVEVTLRELHIKITLQGLSLIFLMTIIAGIILGSGVAITMLQTVFRN